ncbi:MAG: alpha/beta hydrolase [Candidatus Dadabacteria bacterium]|nr:alpha/beta hydrolase [Candidatus Dadabacteria bacterium]
MKAEAINLLGFDIFVRHRIKEGGGAPVLFIHGLGESGRCFFDAFGLLKVRSLIVPDLLGFGKSQKAETDKEANYSLPRQVEILNALIGHFGLGAVFIVGHSYGGVLGTYMCRDDAEGVIKKFVNAEGCIARDTLLESSNAVSELESCGYDMAKFGYWLRDGGFKKRALEDFESASTIKYYDSVVECDPAAFAQTSLELTSRAAGEDEHGNNEISEIYRDLETPRVYCAGARPVMNSAKGYINANGLRLREFSAPSHWIMLDNREEFYAFVDGYLGS